MHYRNLTGAHRSSSYYDPSHDRCDHNMKPGWCRFTGNAGQMMSTQCVPKFHCSAHGPGWLDGDHPMPQEGRVIRRVCFHIEGDCCAESVEIQVRNCGQFVVYHLVPAPKCPFRYCGNEVKEFSSGYKGGYKENNWSAMRTCVWLTKPRDSRRESRGGEKGEFSPPPPSLLSFLHHADAQTSNTSTSVWFYEIITKIQPPHTPPPPLSISKSWSAPGQTLDFRGQINNVATHFV